MQHETSIITTSVAIPTPNVTIRSVLSPPVSTVPLTVSACACVYREQKRFIRTSFSPLKGNKYGVGMIFQVDKTCTVQLLIQTFCDWKIFG